MHGTERKWDSEMAKFRFQDLEIWKMAIEIADELVHIAEQLRGAGMSMS